MNDPALMRVRETGRNLLKIRQRAFDAERLPARQRRHITTTQVFQHDVVKGYSIQIEGGAVAQTADDVGMANAIESDRFILEILDKSAFEIGILITLKQNIESFDNNFPKLLVGRRQIARDINLGITAVAETLFDVVTAVKSAL